MNTKQNITKYISGATAAFVCWAGAQTLAYAQADQPLSGTIPARSLMGDQVQLEGGGQVGEVSNMVVDLTTGRVLYLVVDAGEQNIAIPPGVITATQGNRVRVTGDRQQYRNAPQFTREINQTLSQADFVNRVYQHFGQNIWWSGEQAGSAGKFQNVHRLSDLTGIRVNNVGGTRMGSVNNLAVDLESGRVVFAFLEPSNALNLGQKLFPMPPNVLTQGQGQALTANISEEKLESAPSVTGQRSWDQLATAEFASKVYQFYGKEAWFTSQPTPRQIISSRQGATQQPAGASASLSGAVPAKTLIGDQVQLEDGRQFGEVEDIVVDLITGRMLYAIVDSGNKKVAIPPGVITATQGNRIRLQGDRDKFQNAPEFTQQINQTLSQADFIYRVYQHFGQNIWWQGNRPADQGNFESVHRASNLFGTQVNNVMGKPMGEISNLAIDLGTGRILYAFLKASEDLDLGKNYFPLPPNALTPGQGQTLTSNIDREKLASAPSVRNKSWQQVTTPSFASEVYRFYGKEAWFGSQPEQVLTPTGRGEVSWDNPDWQRGGTAPEDADNDWWR